MGDEDQWRDADWQVTTKPVQVEINSLADFWRTISMDIAPHAATAMASSLVDIGTFANAGLRPLTEGDVFSEGVVLAESMTRRQSDFQNFFRDIGQNLQNTAAAITVIAQIYQGTDAESKASLNDIAFAFADGSAATPKGFLNNLRPEFIKTLPEELQQKYRDGTLTAYDLSNYNIQSIYAQQSGQTAQSLTGDDSHAAVTRPANGYAYYTYPDGSRKTVITRTLGGGTYYSGTETVTTIYSADGKLLKTITEQDVIEYDHHNKTTVTEEGSTKQQSAVSTGPTGTVTVTNSTTVTQPDGSQTTTSSAPVTVDPGDHKDPVGTKGKVEELEDQAGTEGDDYTVKEIGPGY
jgi:hypothetical protein